MSGSHIFILAVIALSLGYALVRNWMNRQPQAAADGHDEADEMLARIDQLEERIRVLERIITDGNYDLKKEIDGL